MFLNKFWKINHPELDISLCLSNFRKEISQLTDWHTYLWKSDQFRNISSSGSDIFLKSFGDIPGMFLHYIQKYQNFLYLCQFAIWLTSLLKLDKYRFISRSGWDIFLKSFGDISAMFVHQFQIILNFLYACPSISWLTLLLKLDKYKYETSSSLQWLALGLIDFRFVWNR